jgi:EAL domain-containing protein (putative c-di-GMP-specific phosphodiesterase class I)
LGVGLALDDFGTGFASLTGLRRFPLTRVKIDRSFIKEIPGSSSDTAISGAIIVMAHGLGLQVVAEGVETPEQADLLHELGCDCVQGYLYSTPVPAAEFVRFLDRDEPVAGTRRE